MSRHTDLIDAVNDARTQYEHDRAYAFLDGWPPSTIRTAAAMRRRWRRSTTRGGKRRPTLADPTIDEQIACVKREIRMRESVYPRWVGNGKMSQRQADRELNAMRAVLATLERVRDQGQPSLFSTAPENNDGWHTDRRPA